MIKFIKKYKLNFISYLFCAFAMALFTIISFSCKTYAYSIDNNGNLVGDNILNPNDIVTGEIVNNQYYISTFSSGDYILNNVHYNEGVEISIQVIDIQNYTSISIDIRDKDNYTYQQQPFYNLQNKIGQTISFYANDGLNQMQVWCNGSPSVKLLIIISYGNVIKEWEPYGVWYSKSNYDTLENQLNTTNGLLELQIDITKYGWLSYIDNLEYYVTGNYVQTFTFNDLKTNNYISNNATLDLYQMSLYQNPNYSYIKFDIYFQNSYANLDYFSANLFDISTKLGFNGVVSIYDTDSNSAVFNITDIASITYEDIIEKNSNFGDYIYNVTFEFASPDASTMIYTNSFYSRGYQTGYSYGSNVSTGYYTPIINDLNARISNLENDILSLNNTIDTLKELNAQYQQQLADNVGWSSLFFAFADTPFKVVSNVLGFELFGLNLFATFIGMITVFGVVYLLKKFL